MITKPNMQQLYWIAGLLEGEGCFQLNHPKSITISLEMIDKDTVTKAGLIIDPIASIREYPSRTGNKLPTYKFQISGEIVIEWMKLLLPLMSQRRQIKINELLEVAKTRKLLPLHDIKEQQRNQLRKLAEQALRTLRIMEFQHD